MRPCRLIDHDTEANLHHSEGSCNCLLIASGEPGQSLDFWVSITVRISVRVEGKED